MIDENPANEAPEATDGDETPEGDVTTPEAEAEPVEDDSGANDGESQEDTFSRDYVEKLRKKSADYRERAQTAETQVDELSKRLHTALVAATGKLQDASDLSYAPEHLKDTEALSAAIQTLLDSKPHLKARKIAGDVGQGNRGDADKPVSLLSLMKGQR